MSLIPNIYTSNEEMFARVFGMGMVNPNNRYKKLLIEDIPLMITENKKIVCIPKTNEMKHIGVTGMTGSAKSVTMNALMHWDYWLLGRDCINLNDYQKETFEWSMPTTSFLQVLKVINANPCPTPLVYVFPATKSLQLEDTDKKFPHIKMTLPIQEVVKNIEYYHKLDKSKLYLGNLIQELAECSSMEEIQDLLEETFPEKNQKGMKFKMQNIFQDLFNNGILNVAVPEAPAFLDYKDRPGNVYFNLTFQTLMRAGFVPSIQTSDLRNYEYMSAYISFLVDSVYKNQYDDVYFRRRNVSMFVDEINKLWEGYNGDIVKIKLNLVGTNGRAARIGLRWSTQDYEKVSNQIRDNTKYLIVLRKKDSKEVAVIKKDFDIPKELEKEILNLKVDTINGRFEAVMLTTEKFRLYDLETGKVSETSAAQRGYIIPSPARHHIPNVPIINKFQKEV